MAEGVADGEGVAKKKRAPRKPAAQRTLTELEVFDPAYEAHRLRIGGMSWRAVARVTGYPSEDSCRLGVNAYLKKAASQLNAEQQAERLAVELDRLDALQEAWWARATGGARDPETGVPLLDEKAAAIVLNVIRTRSKLLGLESQEAEQTTTKTIVVAGSQEEYVAALQGALLTQT